ncbi:MAG: hypothetical protein ACJ788_09140, partial [Ktedonobacteraceae bacterium]
MQYNHLSRRKLVNRTEALKQLHGTVQGGGVVIGAGAGTGSGAGLRQGRRASRAACRQALGARRWPPSLPADVAGAACRRRGPPPGRRLAP